jgi:hypothetical protein
MTDRAMYDSASPDAIPVSIVRGAVVAGYPDFGWSPDDFHRYKDAGATVARITQHDPPDWQNCSIADFEPGAIFSPTSLREFVVKRNKFRPRSATVYSDLANLRVAGRALAGLKYKIWAADWPNHPSDEEIEQIKAVLRPGARLVAIQYRTLPVQDYDVSVVLDATWHKA